VSEARRRLSVAGISLRDGRYFVARRLPGGDMGGRWEFPGGKVEEGEDCVSALHREYDEEFGVPIIAGTRICEVDFRNGGKEYALNAYFVSIAATDEAIELREHSEFRWATFEEILSLDFADSDAKILPFLI